MKHLIIGNGIAGVCAAEAIREIDDTAEIVMIGDEPGLPYSRPMITHVLDGSAGLEKLPVRPTNFYESLGIQPVLGRRATGLDLSAKKALFDDGVAIAWDRLLIATGADPRPVRAQGTDLDNIFFMRTKAQVERQLAMVDSAEHALVLGGGLVGFKSALGLLNRGVPVTMLITSGYPLSMQVDETAGRMILDEMVTRGLTVRTGVSVTAFEGSGCVESAVLDSGERLACDLVIIGKGVLPALRFLPGETVTRDLGVVVDSHMMSSVPDVYAAGDAAECLDIARQRRWVNAIWPEAATQGRIAGLNMAGRQVTYPGSLSRNVMRVFNLDVMTLGYANPGPDEGLTILKTGGPSAGWYRSLVFREDILAGAVLIGKIEQGGVLRSLIQNQTRLPCSREALLSPGFNAGKLFY